MAGEREHPTIYTASGIFPHYMKKQLQMHVAASAGFINAGEKMPTCGQQERLNKM